MNEQTRKEMIHEARSAERHLNALAAQLPETHPAQFQYREVLRFLHQVQDMLRFL